MSDSEVSSESGGKDVNKNKKGKKDKKDVSEMDDESISVDSNDDDIEEASSKIEISKEFQEKVVKYVKLDDLIRKKTEEIAELKKQRKPCEDYILKELETTGESVIDITNGKLRKNKAETKTALSQDIIKDVILSKIKDPNLVEGILKEMDDKRPVKSHVNIKRTHARDRKKGKN